MPQFFNRQPSEGPPAWPAWCVSLAIHTLLFVLLISFARIAAVRGAAEQPSRDVGIVLKQLAEDGPRFEGEADQQSQEATLTAETADGSDLLDTLPSRTELPSTDSGLPQLPALGAPATDTGELASASELTRGGRASRQVGGKARVQVFGIEGEGTKFVYVFDRSISMDGLPLRTAKQQLIESLAPLESVHQFQIIFFNHEPQAWDLTGGQQRIAFATDRNKRLAEQFVRSVTASGGTYRRAALQLALRLRPDVIFFLTDTDDPMSNSDITEATRRARDAATAINTIEFGTGPARDGENFLVRLARETGGRYVYVNTHTFGHEAAR